MSKVDWQAGQTANAYLGDAVPLSHEIVCWDEQVFLNDAKLAKGVTGPNWWNMQWVLFPEE